MTCYMISVLATIFNNPYWKDEYNEKNDMLRLMKYVYDTSDLPSVKKFLRSVGGPEDKPFTVEDMNSVVNFFTALVKKTQTDDLFGCNLTIKYICKKCNQERSANKQRYPAMSWNMRDSVTKVTGYVFTPCIHCGTNEQKNKIEADLVTLCEDFTDMMYFFGTSHIKNNEIDSEIFLGEIKYSLYGIIVNVGMHFISHIKKNDGWYSFNDDVISKINSYDMPKGCNAEMLIYIRKNDKVKIKCDGKYLIIGKLEPKNHVDRLKLSDEGSGAIIWDVSFVEDGKMIFRTWDMYQYNGKSQYLYLSKGKTKVSFKRLSGNYDTRFDITQHIEFCGINGRHLITVEKITP